MNNKIKLKKYKKLTKNEKQSHIAGSASFWNVGIIFSLISSSVMKFISLISTLVNKNKQTNSNLNVFNNTNNTFNSSNYGSNNAYIKLSKYPSKSNVTLTV